jgi:hypothetical protein
MYLKAMHYVIQFVAPIKRTKSILHQPLVYDMRPIGRTDTVVRVHSPDNYQYVSFRAGTCINSMLDNALVATHFLSFLFLVDRIVCYHFI